MFGRRKHLDHFPSFFVVLHKMLVLLAWSIPSLYLLITPSFPIYTEKKREPKWLSQDSHLVVRNSALHGAPFWCYKRSSSVIMKKKKRLSSIKESPFSKLLFKRAILALFFFLSVSFIWSYFCQESIIMKYPGTSNYKIQVIVSHEKVYEVI